MKTKTKAPSKRQALAFALYLAAAENDGKALAMAFEIAATMTKKQVDDAKSWSLRTASPEKLEQAIEWRKTWQPRT